jgi:hypothetical protein
MKKLTKISNNTKIFFEYIFKGDGKYYTTEQGSRHYNNTTFQNFYNSNSECIDIIERGNDAPRGGRTGDYVIVKFNENFPNKWGWYITQQELIKKGIEEMKKLRDAEILAIGDQKELLKKVFIERPDRLERIKTKITQSSSKDWRIWVKMKVCKWVANSRFDLLTLCPTEIREIAFEQSMQRH